ncbi:hypothetical protein MNBD_ALPHA06-749 [hydrothermal vent metagenome]|uniref:DUF3168 domain-containing protein n=1 Tax=hydrothermal vent metagenome TaxID=652676 RepID=A0A3B0S1M0_9ZZZZ
MSNSPELALQEAIFLHLQQDTNVQAALGASVRLYDDPPHAPGYPFASFGRHQSRPLDGDETVLLEQELSLHIWSRHGGKSEAQKALHAFREALKSMPSTMNGHQLVNLRIVFADIFRARDGRVFQAVLRLRALSQQSD